MVSTIAPWEETLLPTVAALASSIQSHDPKHLNSRASPHSNTSVFGCVGHIQKRAREKQTKLEQFITVYKENTVDALVMLHSTD